MYEFLVCLPHVFPGAEHVFPDPHAFLIVLFLGPFMRVYVLVRFYFHHTTLGQAPGRFISGNTAHKGGALAGYSVSAAFLPPSPLTTSAPPPGLTNVRQSYSFMVKTLLYAQPIALVVTCMTAFLLVAAYAIRCIETSLCASIVALQCEPLTLADALWTLMVLITTVG